MSLYKLRTYICFVRTLTLCSHFDLPPLDIHTAEPAPNRIHIPPRVYRIVHLDSASQSRYHPGIPRARPHPASMTLHSGDAVQAYRNFTSSDINRSAIRGHIDYKRCSSPYSPFILVFDDAGKFAGIFRARVHGTDARQWPLPSEHATITQGNA